MDLGFPWAEVGGWNTFSGSLLKCPLILKGNIRLMKEVWGEDCGKRSGGNRKKRKKKETSNLTTGT